MSGKSLVPVGDLLPGITDKLKHLDLVESEIIRPEDIIYCHSLFLQCFLPVRHNPGNLQRWQTNSRNASLVIHAGELIDPAQPGIFRQCIVPAGSKARFLVAYTHDYIYRHKTLEIDLGRSMRKFMEANGVPIGGKNGKELQRGT